jgi:hypothetical protein
MNELIENQQITQTIPIKDLLSNVTIGTWQADFPLTAIDYEHIKNGSPKTFNWANSILLATVGFGFNIFGKLLSELVGVQQVINIYEWFSLLSGVIISFILYIIGLAQPNDKKKIMKKIQIHFNTSPKKRQLVKGEEK